MHKMRKHSRVEKVNPPFGIKVLFMAIELFSAREYSIVQPCVQESVYQRRHGRWCFFIEHVKHQIVYPLCWIILSAYKKLHHLMTSTATPLRWSRLLCQLGREACNKYWDARKDPNIVPDLPRIACEHNNQTEYILGDKGFPCQFTIGGITHHYARHPRETGPPAKMNPYHDGYMRDTYYKRDEEGVLQSYIPIIRRETYIVEGHIGTLVKEDGELDRTEKLWFHRWKNKETKACLWRDPRDYPLGDPHVSTTAYADWITTLY
jgi:hypothetical protein